MTLGIADLADLRPDQEAEYGAKAVGLARLAGDFPVPPAVAIGRRLMLDHVLASGIAGPTRRVLQRASGGYPHIGRDVLTALQKPMQRSLWTRVRSALGNLAPSRHGYAVRSSGVSEDLADASFAGLYATSLNVDLECVEVAVRSCWASQYSQQLAAYAEARGLEAPTSPAMGVIVQEMLAPDFAGVCFTAGPTVMTQHRVVVEAVPGLGHDLVSGSRTPWQFHFDADGVPLGARTPSPRMPRPSDAELSRVVDMALAIDRKLGGPQDIEWALADGRVHLLQARPITTVTARRP
jgi:pyruvate,water dikinase